LFLLIKKDMAIPLYPSSSSNMTNLQNSKNSNWSYYPNWRNNMVIGRV